MELVMVLKKAPLWDAHLVFEMAQWMELATVVKMEIVMVLEKAQWTEATKAEVSEMLMALEKGLWLVEVFLLSVQTWSAATGSEPALAHTTEGL